MSVIWNSAVALLLLTGGLLGLTLPFAKIAGGAGIPPAVWAFVISAGAGAILLTALLARDNQPALDARKLRYFAITAAISYAIPSVAMFSAIPHLGAGYTGIMLALSPVITLLLSIRARCAPAKQTRHRWHCCRFCGRFSGYVDARPSGPTGLLVVGSDWVIDSAEPRRRKHL